MAVYCIDVFSQFVICNEEDKIMSKKSFKFKLYYVENSKTRRQAL